MHAGVCGDPWQHYSSNYAGMSSLPIQATYASGSTINVEWLISANHGGRIGFKLCPRRTNLNQACFDANPLQVGDRFVSEALLGVCDADCEDILFESLIWL
jgi:hypothetical protein